MPSLAMSTPCAWQYSTARSHCILISGVAGCHAGGPPGVSRPMPRGCVGDARIYEEVRERRKMDLCVCMSMCISVGETGRINIFMGKSEDRGENIEYKKKGRNAYRRVQDTQTLGIKEREKVRKISVVHAVATVRQHGVQRYNCFLNHALQRSKRISFQRNVQVKACVRESGGKTIISEREKKPLHAHPFLISSHTYKPPLPLYTNFYTYTQNYTQMHRHANCMYIHTCIHTYLHIHTCIHTYIGTS